MNLRSTLAAMAAALLLTACGSKVTAPPLPLAAAEAPPSSAEASAEVPQELAELKPEDVEYVAVILPIPPGPQVPAPQLEAEPLPGGGYRVRGNGWPEAEQMTIWLDGEGPGTCCPPSNGTRLAVVPVTLGRFAWEGKVPVDGPFSLTVVAEGGGSRGIRVSS